VSEGLRALRILNLEDNPLDAQLIHATLADGGIECEVTRVQTRADFAAALGSGDVDLVLADYSLPSFDGLSALELVQEVRPGVPFVLVSGALGEERAIEALKSGATDYVLKQRLERLVPAVRRAVREADERAERKRAEEALRESEERFRATFEQAAVGIAHVNADGRWLRVNQKLCEIVGYSREELLGKTFQDITHPDDLDADLQQARRLLAGEIETYSMEKRYVKKDDSIVWTTLTGSLVREPSGKPKYFIAVIEDISERKWAEEVLRQKEKPYRAAVEQAADSIFLIDAKTKRILEANTTLYKELGYTQEELRQLAIYDVLVQEQDRVDRELQRIAERERTSLGVRKYRRKDGELLNVEVNAYTIPYQANELICVVAHGVNEHVMIENMLRRSLDSLLALYEASHVLGSSLDSKEIGSRLLKVMQRVTNFGTAVISTPDDRGWLRVWQAVGFENLWERARYAPEVQNTLRAVLETGERKVFALRRPGKESELLAGLGLPLRIRNRSIGVLEAYGPEALLEGDAVDVLGSMASQAASALENARLYGELAEREKRLQDLVGRLLGAHEEERRRVAYEVHDGLTQVAAAAHQHLQAYARRHPPASEKGRRDLERIVNLVRQTVSESRRIIANLRPTTLDDFGLVAAVAMEVERLREEGYVVDYEEKFGNTRLSAAAEIALFRVAQEALTNVRKHARTRRARVQLRRSKEEVRLKVQDHGRGFNSAAARSESGPGERVGLAGMRERIGMLGGKLEVHSRPGAGTSVTATIPASGIMEYDSLEKGRDGH
jgi:PAS domain S-box-containing protein